MGSDRSRTSSILGFAIAFLSPILATLLVWRAGVPPYVFEHLIVLMVVGAAVKWGLSPAIVMAVTAVAADDLLLREPFGTPSISGLRDVFDLLLFLAVAIAVGWLVARSERDRRAAEMAAARERAAREEGSA